MLLLLLLLLLLQHAAYGGCWRAGGRGGEGGAWACWRGGSGAHRPASARTRAPSHLPIGLPRLAPPLLRLPLRPSAALDSVPRI